MGSTDSSPSPSQPSKGPTPPSKGPPAHLTGEDKQIMFIACPYRDCDYDSKNFNNFSTWIRDGCEHQTMIDIDGNLWCRDNASCGSYMLFDGTFRCQNHTEFHEPDNGKIGMMFAQLMDYYQHSGIQGDQARFYKKLLLAIHSEEMKRLF